MPQKSMKRLILPALLLVVIVLFVLAETRDAWLPQRGGSAGAGPPAPGAHLPGLVVPTIQAQSLAGDTINFPDDYRGKLVLLDFWATWCLPCRVEIPIQRAARDRFGAQGLAILGVTLDQSQGVPAAYVQQFVRENGITWPQIYAGAAQIAGAYRVLGVPTAFLIDGDTGQLLATGPSLRGEAMLDTIQKHLVAKSNR